jgi:hypothetical protein
MEIFSKALILIGQRIYCGLYGGKDGIVVAIHGAQDPVSCRSVMQGVGVTGGNAVFDIIWDNGTESRQIPESLARSSVQWTIYNEVVDANEVARFHALLATETARRSAEADAQQKAFEAETVRLREEYPYLDTTEQYDCKRAAKNIRILLKKHFPKVKFSVKARHHSSYGVEWTDGPTCWQVEAIVNVFEAGHFNGMEDIYEYETKPWTTLFGDVQYLSCSRHESASVVTQAIDTLWAVMRNVSELQKPTAETVFNGYVPIPGLSDVLLSELVHVLASNFDCIAGAYINNKKSYSRNSFIIEQAIERQSSQLNDPVSFS